MPKVSEEHLDARREQILEGARRAFARHGYAGATVVRLEQEVGLSRGAIFNYFPGKQALFVAVASRVSVRYAGLVVQEGVDAALRAMAAEDPAWLGVLLEAEAQLRHDPTFRDELAAALEEAPRISPWIEERQRDGTFRDDVPARQLAEFASMLLNGLALRVVAEEETDVDALLRLLHDAFAPRQ